MNKVELKSNIHKIVDGIQDEQLLQTIYDFLMVRGNSTSSPLWNSLAEEQRKEVLLAFDESENEDNLISRKKVFLKD